VRRLSVESTGESVAEKPIKLNILERDDVADLLALFPINTIFTALLYTTMSRILQSRGTLPDIFGDGLDWYVILTKENPGLILGAILSRMLEDTTLFDTLFTSLVEEGKYDPEELAKLPWLSLGLDNKVALFVGATLKLVTGL